MEIKTFCCNPYCECTYVVEWGDKCLIVDPGMYTSKEENQVEAYLTAHHLVPCYILITHGHADHTCGLEWCKTHFPDAQIINNTTDEKIAPCTLLPTPGHKEDAVCFYFAEEKILFSGDTLFRESIGRTDLPGGDFSQIVRSLAMLSTLPDDTTVYPGHGMPTTIAYEKAHNPYL